MLDYLEYRSIDNAGSLPSETSVSQIQPAAENKVELPQEIKEKLYPAMSANPDVYAWITVPGTKIDYPLLQSQTERSYYLTHDINKKDSKYGAIYTQNYNKTDFSDYNTIVYGHNMMNGTMFGTLRKYRDRAFFEQNQYIYVYMPGRILKYHIFAAYIFDDRHILMSFDFSDESQRQLYLDTVFGVTGANAYFREGLAVDTDDKIITLSTCAARDDERYLVQGVLIDDSSEK